MVIRQERANFFNPPPTTRIVCSVLVNGTEYKLKMASCKIRRYATTSAGYAELQIINQDGEFKSTFSVDDIVKIYADYDAGTTQIFEGRLKAPSFMDLKAPLISLTALDYAGDALKKIVNKVYTSSTDAGQVFYDLVTDYLVPLGHTATSTVQAGYASGDGIVTDTGYMVTPIWQNKTLMQCFQDLVTWTNENYAFYCDFGKEWQFFEKGAVYNSVDGIYFSGNLVPGTFVWEKDQMETFNKVTLIGASVNGIPLTATYGTGNLELVKQDANISDWSTLYSKAKSIYDTYQTEEFKGSAKCWLMSTLQPGDSVYVFHPDFNLGEEEYITEFTHEFARGGIFTSVKFQEKGRRMADMSTFTIENMNQTKNQVISDNPYGLKNVLALSANSTDFPTLSGVSISSGALITTGTGNATSRTLTLTNTITSTYFKIIGEDIPNILLSVSFDGIAWETVTNETLYTPIASGATIQVKPALNAATAKIYAIGVFAT